MWIGWIRKNIVARRSQITHSGFLYQVEFVFDDLVLLLGRYPQGIAKQQQLEAVQKFKDNVDFCLVFSGGEFQWKIFFVNRLRNTVSTKNQCIIQVNYYL